MTARFNAPGRIVTVPGFEWFGNTAVGGDRNVYFRGEGHQIRRSSHALLIERHDIDTDAADANCLFKALAEEYGVVYAHVGGRYADISIAHDSKLKTAVEIDSALGSFEWLLKDASAWLPPRRSVQQLRHFRNTDASGRLSAVSNVWPAVWG